MSLPRIYLHPDERYISIGFEDTPDTLLRLPDPEAHGDHERAVEWARAITQLLDGPPPAVPASLARRPTPYGRVHMDGRACEEPDPKDCPWAHIVTPLLSVATGEKRQA